MPDATTPPDTQDDDAVYQRALATLLEIGVSLAQELKPPSTDITLTARATAFKQVNEAVRRTIILARHIAEATPAKAAQQAERDEKRVSTRRRVIRSVEDYIQRKARPADAPSLRVELLERLDSPEFIKDLETRSPTEIIGEICRDLGLVTPLRGMPPALRRTPDDIAILFAQAAAPAGSGLPQWLAATLPQATKNDAAAGIHLKEN